MGKKKTKESWDEFLQSCHDFSLFNPLERPKTFKALKRFWKAASQEEIDRLPMLIIYAPSRAIHGEAFPLVINSFEISTFFIYFGPILERKLQREVNSTVAHELAHALLRHGAVGSPRIDSSQSPPSRHADTPAEVEADKLVEKWGFKPAYDRSNIKPTDESI
jgi:hypothetical protein